VKIAIFGAAGAIGRAVLPEFLARGDEVRLVGRDGAKLEALAAGRAQVAALDLSDPEQARRAADGMDAILFSVGLPYHQSEGYPPLTRVALDAACAAGVRQFMLISTVYAYGRARTPRVAETHPREPHTNKGANRKAQADFVSAAHDPAALQTLVLVLPDFYGPTADLSHAKGIFDAALSGKAANVIGPLDVPREYVYIPDVAPVIAELFARPALFGRTYHLGGAGTITTRAFVADVERAAGRRIKTVVATKTLLRLLGPFNPMLREFIEVYYLFTEPVVLDDALLRSVLPELRKTPYEVGIPATLEALEARPERARA
jgi:nucleoside-diphosphate-sugar epimerase